MDLGSRVRLNPNQVAKFIMNDTKDEKVQIRLHLVLKHKWQGFRELSNMRNLFRKTILTSLFPVYKTIQQYKYPFCCLQGE